MRRNGKLFGIALGFQNIGDQLINAKTTLPWFLNSVGAPGWIIPLLVPIRESLAMLPQVAIRHFLSGRRRSFLLAGTLLQGLACLGMALAVLASPLAAGLIILGSLTLLALARAAVSLTSSDVKGKLIPKGERGRVTGLATTIAGAVAITVGVLVQTADLNFTLIFLLAAAAWVGSFVVFGLLTRELKASNEITRRTPLVLDRQLLRFIAVRSLLLVSALSPPFIVTLAHGSISGLGAFIIANGVASLLSGQVAGYFSDWSSRLTMAVAALAASLFILLSMAAALWFDWALPICFFGIALAHAVVRVARATYIVDIAEGEKRTTYISVANTAMGVILLVVGGITSLLSALDPLWALGALALMGLAAAISSWRLPESATVDVTQTRGAVQ